MCSGREGSEGGVSGLVFVVVPERDMSELVTWRQFGACGVK
jgi:hypothetical protein